MGLYRTSDGCGGGRSSAGTGKGSDGASVSSGIRKNDIRDSGGFKRQCDGRYKSLCCKRVRRGDRLSCRKADEAAIFKDNGCLL